MQNIGTLLSAAIRPNDSLDLIASAYANEIKGGIHSYATILERDSLIIQRRQWGMLVTVYDDTNLSNNKTYQLTYSAFDENLMNNLNWTEYNNINNSNQSEWQNSVNSILIVVPNLPNDSVRYLVGLDQSASIVGSPWAENAGGFISQYNLATNTWSNSFPTNGMTVRVDTEDNLLYKYKGNYPNGTWIKEKLTQVYTVDFIGNGITYSTSTLPLFTQYNNDVIFLSKFNNANSQSVTLNINTIGLKNLKKPSRNGLIDLLPNDIVPNNTYTLFYDSVNDCFQFYSNYTSDAINTKYYIEPNDYIIVPPYCQYWIYGNLTVEGTILNYGKIIIADGELVINNQGTVENFGDIDLVKITKSPSLVREIGVTASISDNDNNNVILVTDNISITIPSGLIQNFECTFITAPNSILTLILASGVTLINNTGLIMQEKLSFTLKARTSVLDEYIVTGNI